jgi:Icc protein
VAAFNAPVLRIAQITDTHLYADPAEKLLGLNTHDCLQQVIDLASQHTPQLVVATGDLTHDGSASAYQLVRKCFSRLHAPVYCLPGNHDEAATLHDCMNDDGYYCTPSIEINGWQLVFLDSTINGSDGGHLSKQELQMLEETPTLVWLHHQPVNMGSRWLDSMAVANPQDFFAVVDRHPQIRGVIWGHVHQCFERQHKHARLLATPSTCIQFLPNSDDCAIEHTPPGYRWFELFSNGDFTTGVERLAKMPGNIDLNASGY